MQNQNKLPNIVVEGKSAVFEVFGPTLQFLVLPNSNDDAPCVLKGTIPPGVSVPIHSHGGMEAFFVLSGEIEVLSEKGGDFHWMKARPGDFIEVSSGVKHKGKKQNRGGSDHECLGKGMRILTVVPTPIALRTSNWNACPNRPCSRLRNSAKA